MKILNFWLTRAEVQKRMKYDIDRILFLDVVYLLDMDVEEICDMVNDNYQI